MSQSISIKVIKGPHPGAEYRVKKDTAVIGRSPRADIQLIDKSVSRFHAKLRIENDRLLLEDLDSTNGTWLFGQRVEGSIPAPPNAPFRLGEIVLTIVPEGGAAKVLGVKGQILREISSLTLDEPERDSSPTTSDKTPVLENKTLAAFYLFQQTMTSQSTEETTQQKALRAFADLTQASKAYLLEYDIKTEKFIATAKLSAKNGSGVHEMIPDIDEQLVEYVKDNAATVLAHAARRGDRGGGEARQSAVICLPLLGKRQLNGILHLTVPASVDYSLDDLRLFSLLAMSAGMTLEHEKFIEFNARNESLLLAGLNAAEFSHCVKNILAAQDVSLNLLRSAMRDKSVELAGEAFNLLSINHRRLGNLALDILNFSGTRNLKIQTHDVNSVITEVIESLKPQFDFNRIGLRLESGQKKGPLYAEVDPVGVRRVLMNLVANAEEAVLAKRLNLPDFQGHVTISSVEVVSNIVITIADDGIGIERADAEKLFDPFHTTKGVAGTGLGLHVSKKLVEAHGGSISVAGNPGEGSVFKVQLPVTHSHADTDTTGIHLYGKTSQPLSYPTRSAR